MSWDKLKDSLDRILSFPTSSFSRERFIDYEKGIIKTDCSGVLHLLLKEYNIDLFPTTHKAWEVFEFIKSHGATDKIHHLSEGNILSWRKINPPQSGDTGHICIIYSPPKEVHCPLINLRQYELRVFEVTKEENGPRIHNIYIRTNSLGVMQSVCTLQRKWKETNILAANLFSQKRPSCPQCHKTYAHCLCSLLPYPKWKAPRIDIIRFPKESKHPLNSVNLLAASFEDIRIYDCEYLDAQVFDTEPILLYPSEKAKPLREAEMMDTSTRFILLDGTWKKTKRLLLQNPWLSEIRHRVIKREVAPLYKIRKEISESHYSSLEVYSDLWQKVEPNNRYKALYLETLFQEMIGRQIKEMGADVYLKNYQHYPGFNKE